MYREREKERGNHVRVYVLRYGGYRTVGTYSVYNMYIVYGMCDLYGLYTVCTVCTYVRRHNCTLYLVPVLST